MIAADCFRTALKATDELIEWMVAHVVTRGAPLPILHVVWQAVSPILRTCLGSQEATMSNQVLLVIAGDAWSSSFASTPGKHEI